MRLESWLPPVHERPVRIHGVDEIDVLEYSCSGPLPYINADPTDDVGPRGRHTQALERRPVYGGRRCAAVLKEPLRQDGTKLCRVAGWAVAGVDQRPVRSASVAVDANERC
jgi:hypothetical protein